MPIYVNTTELCSHCNYLHQYYNHIRVATQTSENVADIGNLHHLGGDVFGSNEAYIAVLWNRNKIIVTTCLDLCYGFRQSNVSKRFVQVFVSTNSKPRVTRTGNLIIAFNSDSRIESPHYLTCRSFSNSKTFGNESNVECLE